MTLECLDCVPDNKSSDQSNLKIFANNKINVTKKLELVVDDNSKFYENGRKFSKQVENTVGKGEIACHVQFLIFSQRFQKTNAVEI